MQDGIVEPQVIEPDHAGIRILEILEKRDDVAGVVAPVADLEGPAQRCFRMLHRQREDVGVGFNVVHIVVTHYRYSKVGAGWGSNPPLHSACRNRTGPFTNPRFT